MNINKTTKRLLSLSYLNVTLDYADGHRWINILSEDCNDHTTLYQIIKNDKSYPNSKVYGNVIDCLNYIDFILKEHKKPTLEEMFDGFNDWGFDDEFVGDHINWEESGTENENYWKERI